MLMTWSWVYWKNNLKCKGKQSYFSWEFETIMRCFWPKMHLCTPFLASTLERMMSKSLIKLLGGGGYLGKWLLLYCSCDGSWSLAAQDSGRLPCLSSSWLSVPFASLQGLHTSYSVHRVWGHFTVFCIPGEIWVLGQMMLSATCG